MTSKLNPYLSFRDSARPAMEFYHSIFGGKLAIQSFADMHAAQDPSDAQKIMHASLTADNGIEFFASDTPNSMEYRPGTTMSMSLSGDNEAELSAYFHKLAAGGAITMPLEKAMWGDTFGMCTDKFGIAWMANISSPAS